MTAGGNSRNPHDQTMTAAALAGHHVPEIVDHLSCADVRLRLMKADLIRPHDRGDYAQVHSVAGGQTVLRSAAEPDGFLVYCAFIAAEIDRIPTAERGSLPVIHDVAFGADGAFYTLADRLVPMPTPVKWTKLLPNGPHAGLFAPIVSLEQRLVEFVQSYGHKFRFLDTDRRGPGRISGLSNIMVRRDPAYRSNFSTDLRPTDTLVLNDPIADAFQPLAKYQIVADNLSAMRKRWPGMERTWRLALQNFPELVPAEEPIMAPG